MFVNVNIIQLVITVNNVLMDFMVMHKMVHQTIVNHVHVQVVPHVIKSMLLVLVDQLVLMTVIPLFAPIVRKEVPVLDVTHVKKIILVTRLDSMGHLPTVNCANVTVTSPRVPKATATL